MTVNIALIGFGGVNRAFVEVLHEKGAYLRSEYDLDVAVVGISDLFLGKAFNEKGLDLKTLLTVPAERGA